jgi:hypothetical protein
MLEGWHLAASSKADSDCDVERALKEKVKLVIWHLRMGVDSGVLSELSINLKPGIGCKIEAIYGETECSTLRPGEIWTVFVKIKDVIESTKRVRTRGSNACRSGNEYSGVDKMIHQLRGMLKPAVSETEFRTIVYATLQYAHSSLPGPAVVRMEGKCQVAGFSQDDLSYDTSDLQSRKSNTRKACGNLFGHQCDALYGHGETVRIKKQSQTRSYSGDSI